MNSDELITLINEADEIGQVPLIQGLHGIGKTECVGQYSKTANLYLEPLILSLMDSGDLLGMPDTEMIGGIKSTVWSAPSWYTNIVNYAWPNKLVTSALQFNDEGLESYFRHEANILYKSEVTRHEVNKAYLEYYGLPEGYLHILSQDNLYYTKGKRSLLFLDELNRSQPDIQDNSLQLILEKRLHSHILPRVMGKDTLIVAAINPSGKQYNVSEFDPALLDRFVFCELEADLPTWKSKAKLFNIHEAVIGFLNNHPKRFHFCTEEGKGTSPRTWVKMSDYLHSIEGKPENGLQHYAIGRLGKTAGVEFLTFYNNYKNTLTVEQLDKNICAALRNKGAKANVEEIAETISDQVEKLDNTQLLSYLEYFKEHYFVEDSSKAKPLLVFLYTLPLEVLSTVLKENKKDLTSHRLLASLDKELNNSNLFLKLTRHLANDD